MNRRFSVVVTTRVKCEQSIQPVYNLLVGCSIASIASYFIIASNYFLLMYEENTVCQCNMSTLPKRVNVYIDDCCTYLFPQVILQVRTCVLLAIVRNTNRIQSALIYLNHNKVLKLDVQAVRYYYLKKW